MGLFSRFFKTAPVVFPGLSVRDSAQAEHAIAGAAKLIHAQYEQAMMLARRHLTDQETLAAAAFAGGILVAAMKDFQIGSGKLAYLAEPYAERWLGDPVHAREVARVILFVGAQPEYINAREAGIYAYDRYHNAAAADYAPQDLAVMLGFLK